MHQVTRHNDHPPRRLASQPLLGDVAGQGQPFKGGAVLTTMNLRLLKAIVVRAKLVKIGNSRGIRLAKPLLEVAGLADEVEIEAAPGVLTIRPSLHRRAGWAEAAAACDAEGLLDEMTTTRFDDKEWAW